MLTKTQEQMNELLRELKLGCVLVEQKYDGTKCFRHYYLHKSEQFVTYRQTNRTLPSPIRYYINQIDEIRVGFKTRTFDRLIKHKLLRQDDEQCAFSIFSNNYRDEINLLANDEEIRNIWIEGLQYLIEIHSQIQQNYLTNETNWILNSFYSITKQRSDSLSKDECRQLLIDTFNTKVSDEDFERFFQKIDKNSLVSDEFLELFHSITLRHDLYKIMKKYANNTENQTIDSLYLTAEQLLEFLQKEQNQFVLKTRKNDSKCDFTLESINTNEQVKELIQQFESNDQMKENGHISLKGFRDLLLSDDFTLMKPWCSRFVYQDMTRPLNDYYINTSYNT
ncbi:unnamed protein product [Adineta ricciae]|uniref:PH domain-containing protein n=2 Tax=Adineta ricciae TaxID=249248 RepID=A0A815KKS7_ADIRI|nr:unnamed protein product [Adineta ricciae]